MPVVEAPTLKQEYFALASIVFGIASIVAFFLSKSSTFPLLPILFSGAGYVTGAIALPNSASRWGGAIGIVLSTVFPAFMAVLYAFMH